MSILEWIATIAGVIGGIAVIWRSLVWLVHMSDSIQDIQKHTQENYMMILRITVMSSDIPKGERIVAGHKYIEAGGNGEVKEYIEKILDTDSKHG